MRHRHHPLAAIYALLLRLHPLPFRERFGEEMQTVFAAIVAETVPLGSRAVASLAARELSGLLGSLVREHGKEWLRSATQSSVLTAILATFYLAAGAYYLTLDIVGALSIVPWFGLVYSLIGAVPGAAVLFRRRHPAVALALILFLALTLTTSALNLGPRKPFLRAASGVRPAMTLAAVDQQLAGFGRHPSTPGTLGPASRVVYYHHFGPGDSDAVVVQFAGGQVISRQVLPD